MRTTQRILVVQTAFIGDVILTLPLLQVLKEFFSPSMIDFVVVPTAADVCRNHPAINDLIVFDKRGTERGLSGLRRLARKLREKRYDLAVVPHRSLRSALLVFMSRIPLRVGFHKSSGRFLLTHVVPYRKDWHEVDRNLSLLEGIGIRDVGKVLPRVFPGDDDGKRVDQLLSDFPVQNAGNMIAIAPGTIWNTKRWPKEQFAALAGDLARENFEVLLVGGRDDEQLCREIQQLSGSQRVHNTAGQLSILQSAELIRRSRALISNDSAPMHLGVSVQTPVIAIFGATIPAFGFAPYGEHDVVVETRGLSCRPCSSHGGEKCPIGTFECMKAIKPDRVMARLMKVLSVSRQRSSSGA